MTSAAEHDRLAVIEQHAILEHVGEGPRGNTVTPACLLFMAMASGASESVAARRPMCRFPLRVVASAGRTPRSIRSVGAARRKGARAPCSDAKSSLFLEKSSLLLATNPPVLRPGAALGHPPQSAAAPRRDAGDARSTPGLLAVRNRREKCWRRPAFVLHLFSFRKGAPMTFLPTLSCPARALHRIPCNL